MISSETPYKVAEIIRDTWPQIYRPSKKQEKKMYHYWVVTEISTGRVIAHCGDERDAIMLVSLNPHNRTYRSQKFILDQVIDISSTTDKQLPGQMGLPSAKNSLPNIEYQTNLPEGKGIPVNTK